MGQSNELRQIKTLPIKKLGHYPSFFYALVLRQSNILTLLQKQVLRLTYPKNLDFNASKRAFASADSNLNVPKRRCALSLSPLVSSASI